MWARKNRFAISLSQLRPTCWPRYGSPVLVLIILLLLAMSSTGCDDKKSTTSPIINLENLLPSGISSWTPSGDAQTGNTEAELRGSAINGYADPYLRNNFAEFALGDYTGVGSLAGGIMTCWIFEMPSATDALGLYNDTDIKPPSSESVADLGDEARSSSGLLDRKLEFVLDEYYISLVVINLTPEVASNHLNLLADHIIGKINN